MGRQEIRAREADGASATPSIRLLSLRPLHNMVELATVLVPEPGTSVKSREFPHHEEVTPLFAQG